MLAATVESWVSTRYAYMGSSVISLFGAAPLARSKGRSWNDDTDRLFWQSSVM